jgi:hypothetical protein
MRDFVTRNERAKRSMVNGIADNMREHEINKEDLATKRCSPHV